MGHAERVRRAKVVMVMVRRETVAVVAAALLPVAVLGLPVLCAIISPHTQLDAVLHIVYVNADCDSILGIPAVVQIIPVPGVVDVHIIVFVPIVWPVLRPRINDAKPKATVLETGISTDHHDGVGVDTEGVRRTKVAAIMVVRDAVAIVAAALLPIAVLRLPVMSATLLPHAPLFSLLNALCLL